MNKFAFIIHPIEIEDFRASQPMLKNIPDFLISSMGKYIKPFKISEIKGIHTQKGEVEGYLIVIPYTLRQMEELPKDVIVNKYIKAGNLAEKLGADIVGLETYSYKMLGISSLIAQKLSIPITTGTTYFLLSAMDAVKRAAELSGKDFKECNISIIGVDKAIGRLVVKLIAEEVKYLTLVSSNRDYLESIEQETLLETGTAVHITDNLQRAVRNGEIIIIPPEPEYRNINIEEVKTDAIICDLSRPRIINKELEQSRQDLLFLDGGLIRLPFEINFGFDFGYSPNKCSPALAETILLTMEEKYQTYSLGQDVDIDKINTIKDMAKANDFITGGITNFYRELHI